MIEMTPITLDVGCGDKPKGNINVDRFLQETSHRTRLVNLKEMNVPNLIKADAHYLPLRNDTFDVVYCHQLLEHKGVEYVAVIKELLRVSRNKVNIEVPSQLCGSTRSPAHDKTFTKHTFEIIFRNYERKIDYTRRIWKYVNMPINFLRAITRRIPLSVPCPVPTGIRVEVWKTKSPEIMTEII